MQFPNITHIDEFKSHICHQEEIREMVIGDDLTSFCYMISAPDTFNTAWARECRGIVFNNKSGAVVARPLHKFFNVNEREQTQLHALDWTKVVRVMDKLDGSMIHTVANENGVRLKSKKSFNSDVALAATDWLNSAVGENTRKFCSHVVERNCTAIFEWTSPTARIVVYYPQEELRLLHIRNNMTGEYLDKEIITSLVKEFNISAVTEPTFNVPAEKLGEHLIELAKTVEGIEGWIVQFENGDMVKLKTDWYLKRHHVMTFMRERDVAEMALNEELDDVKSTLVGEGVDIAQILEIESRVLSDLRHLVSRVSELVEKDKHLERKDFAIKHKNCAEFGLMMTMFSGKEANFKQFFIKYLLKEKFSLKQLNLLQSIGEIE